MSLAKGMDPPVKVACLSCRASRIRCDGKKPLCRNCSLRNRSCVYTRSKRGGPRYSQKRALKATTSEYPRHVSHDFLDATQFTPATTSEDGVFSMLLPGAGLSNLDASTGVIVDVREVPTLALSTSTPYVPLVRRYRSDEDLLNVYYISIHTYFPVLPPPERPLLIDAPVMDNELEFQPSSPISLAILCILSLLPHPMDPKPKSEESRINRREEAHLYARLALESIEIESEVLESSVDPSHALSSNPIFYRERFHSRTPVEYESVLALLLLSIYEYAQRGNLAKMRNRASQALDSALRMSLHTADANVGEQIQEARSRAWWMTYACTLQSAIASNTTPIIGLTRGSFSTPLPTLCGDSTTWAAFLDAQTTIMKCTKFCGILKQVIDSSMFGQEHYQQLLGLDLEVQKSLEQVTVTIIGTSEIGSSNEATLAISLRCQAQIKLQSARIKLHRYLAFKDAPIFTKQHCDLRCPSEVLHHQAKRCFHISPQSSPSDQSLSQTSRSSSVAGSSHCYEHFPDNINAARTCLRAALAISTAFEMLPLPPAYHSDCVSGVAMRLPVRTMPSFACCAMQGSYVLLMLCLKNQKGSHSGESKARQDIEKLHSGVARILAALENYSLAFEAIGGMSDQVRQTFEAVI
ncbi:hypothetical protein P154DRAFT_520948 [Amniculicola lignicola CBS 123094]|uniref:Zn(2)-C6 fungal-type domain-containing protein n=1 Tax=Amniculicola lignicola CBS 123094 TaxID=1392246 RepID=A0A6A5WKV2_9PLEO|nr:hypothetical protein P154DRAFT_520948 [Amniculicola lignicola CBS 123094]